MTKPPRRRASAPNCERKVEGHPEPVIPPTAPFLAPFTGPAGRIPGMSEADACLCGLNNNPGGLSTSPIRKVSTSEQDRSPPRVHDALQDRQVGFALLFVVPENPPVHGDVVQDHVGAVEEALRRQFTREQTSLHAKQPSIRLCNALRTLQGLQCEHNHEPLGGHSTCPGHVRPHLGVQSHYITSGCAKANLASPARAL